MSTDASSVKISTLANGVRVVTDFMPSAASVSIGLWIDVGTRHESEAESGLAHLVEHMLFKGTPTRNAFAIAAEMEAVGGQMNAYTTREQTAYYARVLPEHTELAVDLLSDMFLRSQLDEIELERERGVIIQEIGQSYDTPDDHIFDLLQESAYQNQSMGRPILGRSEIIAKLPASALRHYLDHLYLGGALVLSAAGAVRHEEIVQLAERYLEAVPAGRPPAVLAARYTGGEALDARETEQLHLCLAFASAPYGSADFHTAHVYAALLGGGMSSRLFQEIREKRGLVYSIHSFSAPYRDHGLFVISAGTDPTRVGELLPVTCDEIVKSAKKLSSDEIQRAKAQLRASILMSQESVMQRAEQAAQNLLVHGRIIPISESLEKLEAVDAAALQKFAETMRQGPITLAGVGPLEALEKAEQIAARLRA